LRSQVAFLSRLSTTGTRLRGLARGAPPRREARRRIRGRAYESGGGDNTAAHGRAACRSNPGAFRAPDRDRALATKKRSTAYECAGRTGGPPVTGVRVRCGTDRAQSL